MKTSTVITLSLVFLASIACSPVQAMEGGKKNSEKDDLPNAKISVKSSTTTASTVSYPSTVDLANFYNAADNFDANPFASGGVNWARAAGVPTYATIVQAVITNSVLGNQGTNGAGKKYCMYDISVENNIQGQNNPVVYSIVQQ